MSRDLHARPLTSCACEVTALIVPTNASCTATQNHKSVCVDSKMLVLLLFTVQCATPAAICVSSVAACLQLTQLAMRPQFKQ